MIINDSNDLSPHPAGARRFVDNYARPVLLTEATIVPHP